MKCLIVMSCLVVVVLAGCDFSPFPQVAPPAAAPTTVANPPPVQPAPPVAPVGTPAPMPMPGVVADPAAAGVSTNPPTTPTETIKAEVGVGQKGRSLDEYEGVVVTPVKSLFATRERLTFEVQIP